MKAVTPFSTCRLALVLCVSECVCECVCGLDMTHRRDLGFLSHCRRFGRDLGGWGDPRPSPRV